MTSRWWSGVRIAIPVAFAAYALSAAAQAGDLPRPFQMPALKVLDSDTIVKCRATTYDAPGGAIAINGMFKIADDGRWYAWDEEAGDWMLKGCGREGAIAISCGATPLRFTWSKVVGRDGVEELEIDRRTGKVSWSYTSPRMSRSASGMCDPADEPKTPARRF